MKEPSKEARKRGRKQKIHTAYSDFTLADARKDYEERREQYRTEDKDARRKATAKLNDVEPFAYLKDVLERMSNGHPTWKNHLLNL